MDLQNRKCKCGEELRLSQTDVNVQIQCFGINPDNVMCLNCLTQHHDSKWAQHQFFMSRRDKINSEKERRRLKKEREVQRLVSRVMNSR